MKSNLYRCDFPGCGKLCTFEEIIPIVIHGLSVPEHQDDKEVLACPECVRKMIQNNLAENSKQGEKRDAKS
jgi:hypothetical protein